MGKKITIQGKVHNVGYRLFLLEQADAAFIPFFDARNIKINNKEVLIILVDGEESQLDEFVDFVNSNYPGRAEVKNVTVEDYPGKIREIDKFRQSLNTLQLSKIVQSGLEISVDTKSIKEGIGSIKEDTKSIKEGIGFIKEDTKSIREGVGSIKEDTQYLPEIRDGLKEIKTNTHRTNQLLEEKFAKLENGFIKLKLRWLEQELRFKSRSRDVHNSVPITLYPSSIPSSIEPSCLMMP